MCNFENGPIVGVKHNEEQTIEAELPHELVQQEDDAKENLQKLDEAPEDVSEHHLQHGNEKRPLAKKNYRHKISPGTTATIKAKKETTSGGSSSNSNVQAKC